MVFGTAQGNTIIARETASVVATAVDYPVAHAISAHVSGVRALSERVLWLRVGEPLAFGSAYQHRSAFAVTRLASVIPERELIDVTRKVSLADMVERTNEAAFQQSEKSFDGVRVDEIRSFVQRLGLGSTQ